MASPPDTTAAPDVPVAADFPVVADGPAAVNPPSAANSMNYKEAVVEGDDTMLDSDANQNDNKTGGDDHTADGTQNDDTTPAEYTANDSSDDEVTEVEEKEVLSLLNFSFVGTLLPLIATLPFEVVRTLIQLGHEPVPPVPKVKGVSLLGTRKLAMYLPNGFTYWRHLKADIGWKALYRPLSSKLFALMAEQSAREHVRTHLSSHIGMDLNATLTDEQLAFDKKSLNSYLKGCAVEATAATVATVASFPFAVTFERCVTELIFENVSSYSNPFAIWRVVTDSSLQDLAEALKPRIAYAVLYALSAYTLRQLVVRLVPHTPAEAEEWGKKILGDIQKQSDSVDAADGYVAEKESATISTDSDDEDEEFGIDNIDLGYVASTPVGQLFCISIPMRQVQLFLYPLLHVSTRLAVASSTSLYDRNKKVLGDTMGPGASLQRYPSWYDCYAYIASLGVHHLSNGYSLLYDRKIANA
ncbi:hypothetical protein SARC_05408 [Sphaeroforma arctica JP610]|uniref:Mitochondrial carrier n=1 Tax=Sphaeroforma arctica JP610 TaxID=667725 RepID=A0A0L0G0E8_9EUKA|nr:hypothetical protein SARC_05408 [Sphaeroforma arctica JP610]KNC82316.1 hypothetical protein SARC_05408 [Sphaeroforma arctica JP610]|eukprot:XP_014156218.1 hypothetical protein SARC_05408 [Sphaeroforma arctica JP610]